MYTSKFTDPPHSGAWNVLTGPNGSGKSRYLGQLAEDILDQLFVSKNDKYSKLVCLSGTVFERFPRAAYEIGACEELIYLGHKTNNNMFSAISPFRRLVPEILRSHDRLLERCKAACDLLEGLGLEGRMRVRFRQGRNAKDTRKTSSLNDVDIKFVQHTPTDVVSWAGIVDGLAGGVTHVSDIQFFKGADELSLANLSSGERGYILAGLAFCFCTANNSLVLFDEPENSLHPEWQGRIINDLDQVLRSIGIATTVVVATHSPLIAASVPNKSGYICDLETDQVWRRLAIFGMNADNVLSEQFGLRSARSAQAVDVIQRCLTLIASAQEDGEEFLSAGNEFIKLDLQLTENDPLFKTAQTIKTIIEAAN